MKYTFKKLGFSQKRFLDFLRGNPKKVAVCQDSYHCPLAKFVSENNDVDSVAVDGQEMTVRSGDDESYIELPQWAQTFVKKFDALEKADKKITFGRIQRELNL